MRLLRTLAARFAAWRDRRWLDAPDGCCDCGTGGPYYVGDGPQVTRYLYSGAVMLGFENDPDAALSIGWSSCSAHPIEWAVPVVDYGRDVVVTGRQAEADFAAAIRLDNALEG